MATLLNSVITFPISNFVNQPTRYRNSRFYHFSSTTKFKHSIKSIQHSNNSDTPNPLQKKYPVISTVMDVNQICEILSNRFPFLMVDRVIEYNPRVSIVAIKNVTINDYFLAGHFPGKPIMPGVLILEAMAQVGGLIALPEFGGFVMLAGIEKVTFKKQVVPGDTLVIKVKAINMQKRFKMAKLEGLAYVGDQLVAQANFLLAST